jgi:hypothetical protein
MSWIAGIWAARISHYEGLAPVSKYLQSDTTLNHGETRAYLGVWAKDFQQGEGRAMKILAVIPNSPAAKGGVRADRDYAVPEKPKSGKAGTYHCGN